MIYLAVMEPVVTHGIHYKLLQQYRQGDSVLTK